MQNNSAVVRRFIEETINQGRIDSAVQFVWEDMVEQVPFPGQGPGLEGLKDVLRGMRAGFPDLYFSVEEQIAESDKVVTRFEWTGTHQGEFLGVAATGRSVKVWGIVIDRLESGRIKDTRIIMDTLGLMMQLGVFPRLKFDFSDRWKYCMVRQCAIRTGRALAHAVEIRMTQEISGLSVPRRVPDVQNFDGIVFYTVRDDMRQAPL
jgi:steroid delta-isomerase-like uncharacterized protein